MLLSDAVGGKKYKISKISYGETLRKRLFDLGMTPSCVFIMINNTKKGPVLVQVRGTRVAMGRGMCKKIEVTEIE